MYTELACLNHLTFNEVLKDVWEAIRLGIHGISVPMVFLAKVANVVPDNIVLSCPIDYPLGCSDTSLRNHAILSAIHNKVTAIDLVAQLIYLVDGDIIKFTNDLSSAKTICDNNNVDLRVIIDYKRIDMSLFIESCVALNILGIEYGFAATGLGIEDYEDNILLCYQMQYEYGIRSIANGNIYLPNHYQTARDSKIFGIRWNTLSSFKRCIGV